MWKEWMRILLCLLCFFLKDKQTDLNFPKKKISLDVLLTRLLIWNTCFCSIETLTILVWFMTNFYDAFRMLKYLYIFQDWIHYGWICYVDLLWPDIENINSFSSKPTLLDVGLRLNVHKTLREHLVCFLNVLRAFISPPVSRGYRPKKLWRLWVEISQKLLTEAK